MIRLMLRRLARVGRRINRRGSRCHDRRPLFGADRRRSRSSRPHPRRTRAPPWRAPSAGPTCRRRSKPARRKRASRTGSIRRPRRTPVRRSPTSGTSAAPPDSIRTRSSGRAAVNAAKWPLVRRHCVQWQSTTARSGPRTSYRTAPQRQPPVPLTGGRLLLRLPMLPSLRRAMCGTGRMP